jgi:hypothetical protein
MFALNDKSSPTPAVVSGIHLVLIIDSCFPMDSLSLIIRHEEPVAVEGVGFAQCVPVWHRSCPSVTVVQSVKHRSVDPHLCSLADNKSMLQPGTPSFFGLSQPSARRRWAIA